MAYQGALTTGAELLSLLPRTVGSLRICTLLLLASVLLPGCRSAPAEAALTPTVTPVIMEFAETPLPTVVIALAPSRAPTVAPTATPTATPEVGRVVAVMDGDTIRVQMDGRDLSVRYVLVEAPALDTPLGALALDVNRALVDGQVVRLERDVSNVDRENRLLRYVYLEDGRLVNAELLRQGWVRVAAYPPDVAKEAEFRELEAGALEAGVGMWTGHQHAVTNGAAEVRFGPGETFDVVETLPTNTLLTIEAVTPDGAWYRLAGGMWIAQRFVTNAPQVEAITFAAIDTPLPTPTETPTETPTPTPTISPTPTFAPAEVVIEWLDKEDEFVMLRNGVNRAVELEDWKILSERGGEICILGGVLEPLQTLTVWMQRGGTGYSCNLEFPIFDDLLEDSALLYSPSGFIISRYQDPHPDANLGGEEESSQ